MSSVKTMASDPFAFTSENYTSIPEVFQDSGSEEEFLGFTSQDVADVAFGRNSCIE